MSKYVLQSKKHRFTSTICFVCLKILISLTRKLSTTVSFSFLFQNQEQLWKRRFHVWDKENDVCRLENRAHTYLHEDNNLPFLSEIVRNGNA